ncbi:MAG: hypothetical protein FWG24_02905 [Eggerthellaceae bacterium]|nr:hypothetical protein [Eggerthellaceae bacterium]MDR2721887.1 hypothetical protein [Coriobacteriaceae bacterium]
MFEQDYLMRMILQFTRAINRSMLKAAGEEDFEGSAKLIEAAIGDATDMDGDVLLSLAPESMAGVLHVSGTDPKIAEYIAQSLLLEASYLRDAELDARADLREAQARALAQSFGFEIGLEELTEEEWEEIFLLESAEDKENLS